MTVPQPALPEAKPAFEPSAAQLQREAKLKRFNRLFVYTPLVLVGLIIVALFVLMVWRVVTIDPSSENGFYPFVSGLADLLMIFNLLPMMMLCLTGPALLALLLRSSFQRQEPEIPQQHGKFQVLLWRVDSMIGTLRDNLRDSYLEKGVKPLVTGHALAAAVHALARHIQNIFWTRKE